MYLHDPACQRRPFRPSKHQRPARRSAWLPYSSRPLRPPHSPSACCSLSPLCLLRAHYPASAYHSRQFEARKSQTEKPRSSLQTKVAEPPSHHPRQTRRRKRKRRGQRMWETTTRTSIRPRVCRPRQWRVRSTHHWPTTLHPHRVDRGPQECSSNLPRSSQFWRLSHHLLALSLPTLVPELLSLPLSPPHPSPCRPPSLLLLPGSPPLPLLSLCRLPEILRPAPPLRRAARPVCLACGALCCATVCASAREDCF